MASSNLIIESTINFVKQELASNDSSHDWYHIERVMCTAEQLIKEENFDNVEKLDLEKN